MASFFSITTPTQPIELDSQGRGTVVFSVKNEAPRAVSVRCEPRPDGDTGAGWLSIQGSEAVHLEAGETAQMVVAIEAPPGSAPGTYACRLKAYDTERPDENYAVGQSARFVVTGAGGKTSESKPMNWVFAAVLAVLLLGGGGVAIWLWLGAESEVEAPDLIGRQWAEVDPATVEGFTVVTNERVTTEAAPGTVLAQFPEPGISVPRGGELEVTLAAASAPPADVQVLNFVGSKVGLLQTWAESNKIELQRSESPSDEPEGTVVAQDPAEGVIQAGDVIRVKVAVPESTEQIPSERGRRTETRVRDHRGSTEPIVRDHRTEPNVRDHR